MTRKLKEGFTKWGLEINMSKTKYLAIGATAQDMEIGGDTIEACMEFKYLGVTFTLKSVLLYGCQTWLVTCEIQRKLQSFVNRCLRYIMKIWWARIISNEKLVR
jgi:hypothetical protein